MPNRLRKLFANPLSRSRPNDPNSAYMKPSLYKKIKRGVLGDKRKRIPYTEDMIFADPQKYKVKGIPAGVIVPGDAPAGRNLAQLPLDRTFPRPYERRYAGYDEEYGDQSYTAGARYPDLAKGLKYWPGPGRKFLPIGHGPVMASSPRPLTQGFATSPANVSPIYTDEQIRLREEGPDKWKYKGKTFMEMDLLDFAEALKVKEDIIHMQADRRRLVYDLESMEDTMNQGIENLIDSQSF